jgi:uncharacterized protein YjbJ (UPF0337 family)
MSWSFIESNWQQMRNNLKHHWGRLTDEQLDRINGERDTLAWKIQEVYGTTRENAEMQIKAFEMRSKDFFL